MQAANSVYHMFSLYIDLLRFKLFPALVLMAGLCLLLFTCNCVVSFWRGFLFLWVLRMGYIILLWHSLSLQYNYFGSDYISSWSLLIFYLRYVKRHFIKKQLIPFFFISFITFFKQYNYINQLHHIKSQFLHM